MKKRFLTHRSRRWRSQLGKTMRFESFWRQKLTLVSICCQQKHCAFSSGNYTSCPASCMFYSGTTIHLDILWSSCESRTWTITCCVLKRQTLGYVWMQFYAHFPEFMFEYAYEIVEQAVFLESIVLHPAWCRYEISHRICFASLYVCMDNKTCIIWCQTHTTSHLMYWM